MGDLLKDLPTDYIPPSADESDVLRVLYDDSDVMKHHNRPPSAPGGGSSRTLADEITTAATLAIVFAVFAGGWWDDIIGRMIPPTKGSAVSVLIVKSVVFMMVAYIMLNSGILGRPTTSSGS